MPYLRRVYSLKGTHKRGYVEIKLNSGGLLPFVSQLIVQEVVGVCVLWL